MGFPVSITICTASALNCGLNRRRCSAIDRSSQSRGPVQDPWYTPAGVSRDGNVRRVYPRLKDVEWLRERYVVQGARIGDIAAEVGCGELAVRGALARARIP